MAGKLQVHSPLVAVQVMTGFSKPELLWTLPFEGAWSTSLAFAGDDRIVAGNRDGSLFVWNLPVEPPAESDGKTALISEYRSSRDSFDRPAPAFRLWDVETQKTKLDLLQIQFPKMKAKEYSYGSAQVWRKFVARGLIDATFSPDGKLVATGQSGEIGTGQVYLFKTDDGKLLKTIGGHRYGVTDAEFIADAGHVVSVGRDTNVRITKIDDGKEVAVLGKSRSGQFKDWLSAVAFSPSEKYLAATDIAGKVHVWSLN